MNGRAGCRVVSSTGAIDPARTGELIDAYERAVAALERARADIDAEIASLRAQYGGADPAGKAAVARGIQQLELRVGRRRPTSNVAGEPRRFSRYGI